jgi:hypothetical protein
MAQQGVYLFEVWSRRILGTGIAIPERRFRLAPAKQAVDVILAVGIVSVSGFGHHANSLVREPGAEKRALKHEEYV